MESVKRTDEVASSGVRYADSIEKHGPEDSALKRWATADRPAPRDSFSTFYAVL